MEECLGYKDSPFRQRLKAALDQPFDYNELAELWGEIGRKKPVTQRRETRKRSLEVLIEHQEGVSYLDQNPEFADKLNSTTTLEGKLQLLRGFFCWLQYACLPGSYKPWLDMDHITADEDCRVITDEPQVEMVVVDLTQEEDNVAPSPKQCLSGTSLSQEWYLHQYENVKLNPLEQFIALQLSSHKCANHCGHAHMHGFNFMNSDLYRRAATAHLCPVHRHKCITHQNHELVLIDDEIDKCLTHHSRELILIDDESEPEISQELCTDVLPKKFRTAAQTPEVKLASEG